MARNNYLITLWIDWYDFNERILQKFSIEYETGKLNEANCKFDEIVRGRISEGLREFQDFAVRDASVDARSILVDVNKNNTVIKKVRKKIGDGSGRSCIYYDFDLIKVPAKTKIDENLFNLFNCEHEVKNFFQYRYKQSQKSTTPEKRFIGVKELAKSKLALSSFTWLSRDNKKRAR